MKIQTTQNDLFPETLLVSRNGDRIFTTSVHMAEHFGKAHRNVMRAIYKAIEDSPSEEQLLNFEQLCDTYTVRNGAKRKRKIFHLTHDGFMFVAQSFTGKKATAWKWKFIAAFRQMEAELLAALNREASALYTLRPHWREIGEGTAAGLDRAAICRITGHKSPNTANRRRMRNAGLLV